MKKALIAVLLIILLVVLLTGCSENMNSTQVLAMIGAWLQGYEMNLADGQEGDDSGAGDGVLLRLTYPAGRSPNVFTTGWLFGASCTYKGEDYSDQVKWSGTGSFSPDTGNRSRPSFNSTGSNTINLAVKIEGKEFERNFKVNAVSPAGYACVGMIARCDAHSLGCIACPHTTAGPITTGSSHVLINGKPAARVGDRGVTAGGCGPGDFEIISGDDQVLINGRRAVLIGESLTRHAGGMGKIVGGGN